ncbi:hypothetical protein ACOSP7_016631 [Xanthoceras sorbifolium]
MRALLWDRLKVKVQKQEELGISIKGSTGIVQFSLVGAGDGSEIKEGSATITATVDVAIPMKKMTMREKEKEEGSRLGPAPRVYRVGLEGLGERVLIESGNSVGLGVEAHGGNSGGAGVNLKE